MLGTRQTFLIVEVGTGDVLGLDDPVDFSLHICKDLTGIVPLASLELLELSDGELRLSVGAVEPTSEDLVLCGPTIFRVEAERSIVSGTKAGNVLKVFIT